MFRKDELRKFGISCILPKLVNAGQTPPRVNGIKIEKSQDGKIILDANVIYIGDCEIVLDLHLAPVKKPLSLILKNVSFDGTLRVQIEPSIEGSCALQGIEVNNLKYLTTV